MSKITTGIIIGLLAVVAAGCWAVFVVEKGRQDSELRQLEAQRQAALESEAYGAWHHATRYETFRTSLANSQQEPQASSTFTSRDVWIKSFQRTDVKLIGKSQKYGNAIYQVTSIIGFNDRVSRGWFAVMLRKNPPISVIRAALNGEWHHLTVQCKVEKMDGPGEWIASDWRFSPLTYSGDFPFNKIKGDD
jgi:hypothetical protein